MPYARIIGTGHFLPEYVLTNYDMEERWDTTHEWIVERSGIEQRHWVQGDESNADMAEKAARQAMEAAGVEPHEIEMIVVGTCSPDHAAPSVAALIQDRLGIPSVPCFDVNAACAGYIYSLSVADKFIRTGAVKTALVLGSERLSPHIDGADRSTAVLFGDGCGATVVQAHDEVGLIESKMHCDGSKAGILALNNGITPGPVENRCKVHMQGQDVFKSAVKSFDAVLTEVIGAAGLTADDIDWFIPHQANLRIIQAVAKRMRFPLEKTIITVDKTANTSASTVPIALDIAVRDGRIKEGDTVLTAAFGAGLVWAGAVFTF